MKNFYETAFLDSQHRLLNLLNKNPASKTYGCFDRSYWLHRKVDFPASTAQLSMLTFSYFYKHQLSDKNHFYQNKNVLNWIFASLRYTLSIQNSDGSYDEWYPNERGWGGPTGYIVSAMAETYLLLEEHLSLELKQEVQKSLKQSVDFLLIRDESDVLTNHYAIVLNGIAQANEILSDPNYSKSIHTLTEKILSFYTKEGWSLEYDGCDLGYNLGTLNFLVDVYNKTKDQRILKTAQKSLIFLAHFISPDNQWMANLSSRHTIHNYYSALEFWSRHCAEAHPLLHKLRQALTNRHDLLPMDQEDHYIHYRTCDYIKAFLNYNPSLNKPTLLPYEQSHFSEVFFSESGFFIKKWNQTILWMSTKRGGSLCIYHDNKCLQINNGVMFANSKNRVYTNLWQSSKRVAGELSIQSECAKLFDTTFRPTTFIAFRAFLIFISHAKLAYFLKRMIRKILITFKANTRDSSFTRSLQITENKITIEDTLVSSSPVVKLFSGGNFHTRFVPQGHYFQMNDLNHQPTEIPITTLKNTYKITTIIDLENNKVELCAE